MKTQALLFVLALVLTGCGNPQIQQHAAESYKHRVGGTTTAVSRVVFRVPQGSTLVGGFELSVSDPGQDVGPYEPPETTGQVIAKETGETLRAVAPLAAAAVIATQPASVVRPEVVSPEVVQVPVVPTE